MENFVVSARKYRPATFDMVVGQASITNTLKNAIKNNHLAQAFLFCGPRGVGKTTCARIMAKTINCQNLTANIEACNECKSCVSFNESNSFNVHELDAASNNSVDDIRSLVDQVRIPPHIGKYKVYVIDEVHMLSQAAFNAFLKTLEEPPAYAKFILATTEKHKIIPTILSRCQIFDFNRITINDIARQLEFVAKNENIETEYDALHIIAQKADGAMRDALSIFDQIVSFAGNRVTYKAVVENLNVLDYDYFFNMTDHILSGNTTEILLLYNTIIGKGFEGAHFVSGFSSHLRNLLMCKDPKTIKLMDVGENIKYKYVEQAKQSKSTFLLKALDLSNKCDISYRNSNNKRLHVELTLLQMAALLQAETMNTSPSTASSIATPKPTNPGSSSQPASPSQQGSAYKKEATTAPTIVKEETQTKTPEQTTPRPENKLPATGFKSPSIKGITSKSEEEKKKGNLTPDTDENQPLPNERFSLENLIIVWNKLKENYKEKSASIYTALNTNEPHIIDEHTFEIRVDNLVQKDHIMEHKPDILHFFRSNLNNYALNFNVIIKDKQQIHKAYLPSDKFQKMIEKNPDVEKLKNDLDLDLIY